MSLKSGNNLMPKVDKLKRSPKGQAKFEILQHPKM